MRISILYIFYVPRKEKKRGKEVNMRISSIFFELLHLNINTGL